MPLDLKIEMLKEIKYEKKRKTTICLFQDIFSKWEKNFLEFNAVAFGVQVQKGFIVIKLTFYSSFCSLQRNKLCNSKRRLNDESSAYIAQVI